MTLTESDCEDHCMQVSWVLGCGSVIASVTQILTGSVPLTGLVRSRLPAPARFEQLA